MKENENIFSLLKGEKENMPFYAIADRNYKIHKSQEDISWYLWIKIRLKEKDENGLTTRKEAGVLNREQIQMSGTELALNIAKSHNIKLDFSNESIKKLKKF